MSPNTAAAPPRRELPITMPDDQFRRVAWRLVYGGLKGGIGKTTMAWLSLLYIALRNPGDKVLGVCADPLSQTLLTAYNKAVAKGLNPPFTVVRYVDPDGWVSYVNAEMQRQGARHCVIDVGGESEQLLERACLWGEQLVVPTTPNPPELWRLQSTFDAAGRAANLSDIDVNILLVKAALNSVLARNSRKTFAKKDWPVLDTQIPLMPAGVYAKCLTYVPDMSELDMVGSLLCELAEIILEEETA